MITSVVEWLATLHLNQYLTSLRQAGYTTLQQCSLLSDDKLDRIGISLPGHKKRILAHLPNAFGKVEQRTVDTLSICSGEYDFAVPVFPNDRDSTSAYVNVVMESNEKPKEDIPPLPPKVRSRRSNDSLFGKPLKGSLDGTTAMIPLPRSDTVKNSVSSQATHSNAPDLPPPPKSLRADHNYSNVVLPTNESISPTDSTKKAKPRPTPRPRLTKQKDEKSQEGYTSKPVPRPRSRQQSKEIETSTLKQLEEVDGKSSMHSETGSIPEDLVMESNELYIPSGSSSEVEKVAPQNKTESVQGWAAKQFERNSQPAKIESSQQEQEAFLYSEAIVDKPIELDFTGGLSDQFDINPVYSGAGEPFVSIRPEPDGADSPEIKNRSFENLHNGSKNNNSHMDATKPKTAHYEMKGGSQFPEDSFHDNVYAAMDGQSAPYSDHKGMENIYSEMGEETYGAMWEYSSVPGKSDQNKIPNNPPVMEKIKSADNNDNFLPLAPKPKKQTTKRMPGERNESDSDCSLEEPTFAPPPLPRDFSKQATQLPLPPRPAYFQATPLSIALQGKPKMQEPVSKKPEDDPFMLLANSRSDVAPKKTVAPWDVKDFDPLYQLEEEATNVYSDAADPPGGMDETAVYEGFEAEKTDVVPPLQRKGSFGPPPPPPPRKANPFAKYLDRESGIYHFDHHASASGVSIWESDDTLSDGGDFVDEDDYQGFTSNNLHEAAIPIVPATPTKSCKRAEYLYKQASKHSSRTVLGWMKRWVTFDGKLLKWFSNEKSRASKRIIPTSTMISVEFDQTKSDGKFHSFKIVTVDRVYWFAAESFDIATLWASTIMQGILSSKGDHSKHREGGDMYMPDKEGYLKVDGLKGKRLYLAVKKDKFCYYNTHSDFKAGCPIHCVDMNIATVKDGGRNKLELITPYARYLFLCDSLEEYMNWKIAFEVAIAEGLADDSILEQAYDNHSNRFCADCGAPDPHWASVNFGITLCQHCAGVHRMLADPSSKIRSLRMDHKVWTPSLLKMMLVVGNDNSNRFWEWNSSQNDRIDSDVDMAQRKSYILQKYKEKQFCKFDPAKGDVDALNASLCKAVQYDDVLETMSLVFSGAQVSHLSDHDAEHRTPLRLSRAANQVVQAEFLYQNGADENLPEAEDNDINMEKEKAANQSQVPNIELEGFLHKTGPNQKDFLRRFCRLKQGTLSYKESEGDVISKDNITNREMLALTRKSTEKYPYAFEISTRRANARIYLFASETEQTRTNWLSSLAKVISLQSTLPCDEFERGGLIHFKKGATEEWQRTWIQTIGTTLHICDKMKQTFEKIDLRTLTNIQSLKDDPAACPDALERGSMFVLDTPGTDIRALYLQADLQRDTDDWFKFLRSATTGSGGTLEEQQLTADSVPIIVEKCISHVDMHGLNEDGIYRKSGQEKKIKQLLESLKRDARNVPIRPDEYDVHEVTNALRRFFRGLDEALFTNRLYTEWIQAAGIKDKNEKVMCYQNLLTQLPYVNLCTLKRLVFHLVDVAEAENRMTYGSLAVVFSPALFAVEKQTASTQGYNISNTMELTVVSDLLSNHDAFFKRRGTELAREQKIRDAIKKMEDLAVDTNRSQAGAFIVGVKLLNGVEGEEEIPVKVPMSRIAAEVVDQLVVSRELPKEKNWGLFEVICGGDLERPLHPSEKVLEVTMRWADWHKDFTVNNHLCLKPNTVYSKVNDVFDPQLSLFSELKLSDKKSFKKYYFEFSQSRLKYFKSTNTHEPEASWEVEKLWVYLGVPSKRSNPPTRYNFTFITFEDDLRSSGNFGRSICCNTEEELYRWLAGMLKAKYPQGLDSRTQLPSQQTSPASPDKGRARKAPSIFSIFTKH